MPIELLDASKATLSFVLLKPRLEDSHHIRRTRYAPNNIQRHAGNKERIPPLPFALLFQFLKVEIFTWWP